MVDEVKGSKLARYRVGEEQSNGKDMTAEEISLRRQYIRTMLRRVTPWDNLTDEQLDNVRIFKAGKEWHIEDQDYYEYQF